LGLLTGPVETAGRGPKGPAPFALLWSAQFLSQFGDSMFQIAFVWLILDLTGSKSTTGVAATVSYLPSLLFGVVAGVLVDRWNRRKVMAMADGARAALLGLAGALLWRGALTPTWLTAIAFAMATAAVLFNPARDSLLPGLVEAGGLTRANAWIQGSQQAALFFGPLAAGVVIAGAGVGTIFPSGVLLFGGSLAFILLIRGPGVEHRAGRPAIGLSEDFRSGLREIAANRPLVLLLVLTALDNLFLMGPAILGNVVIVRDNLHGTASDYALVEAVYGVGMVIGSLAIARYGSRIRVGRLLLIGITLDGLTYVPFIWCRTLRFLLIGSFLHSIVIPAITVCRSTILQGIAPSRLIGRAFALQNVTVVGMTALSTGLAGLVLERMSAPVLFAVGGGLAALTGLVGSLSPRLRKL
jgi:MFS transporter, DHA3 family, macrolide efflux protein